MKHFLIFLLLILFSACKGQSIPTCLDELEKKLEPVLNKDEIQGEVINIRDSITCLDWDSLLIESGYATKESIKKNYGFEILYDFNNSELDSDALIFFIKDFKIINHIKFRTTCARFEVCKTYDFKTLIKYNKNAVIPRKYAIFEVYTQEGKSSRGNPWVRKNAIRIKK